MAEELRNADVLWLVRKLPEQVRHAAESRNHKLFIAGGFIRATIAGETVNDVDMFTDSLDSARSVAAQIHRGGDTSGLIETPNAITVRSTDPVSQIIHRWTFDNLRDCVDSFDFTIARAGLTYDGKWLSFCDEDFYSDLAAKRLRYRAPDRREDEAGSMLRMLKFYGRGYRAPLYDIAAVTARAMKGCGAADVLPNEDSHREFILKRLQVIDPSADPEAEGHLG